MKTRQVIEQMQARPASDGDGVKLLRVFGGARPQRFDPFLMLDEFGSESADDYIGGFPSHPHRGFETITYMLQGKMEHRDHMDNVGLLSDGDVQWMTAGSGIIHSEMPQQTAGRMRGFQLWLNLPSATKMQAARYADVAANNIPIFAIDSGITIKAIAGTAQANNESITGYFTVPDTEAMVLDVHLSGNKGLKIHIPDGHNAMIYVYEGEALLGDKNTFATAQVLSRLTDEGMINITAPKDTHTRLMVLSGKPIKEPIAQYGPFVMNTLDEIDQAIQDYQGGTLTP